MKRMPPGRRAGRLAVGLSTPILLIVAVIWSIPIIGLLAVSLQDPGDGASSGWWTIVPHQAWVSADWIRLDSTVEVNRPITLEGKTANVTQWQAGIRVTEDRMLKWIGDKQSRTVQVLKRQRLGFSANLSLNNYAKALGPNNHNRQDSNNVAAVDRGGHFFAAIFNSLTVAIPATIIPLATAAFAAFAFAWMEFPGRKSLFAIVVALLVVPAQVTVIPILMDFTRLGINQTFLSIWLVHAGFGLPLAVYLLFNHIGRLPRAILESAFLDGASALTGFIRIVLPLARPALASFAVFQFVWVWNDYLLALVFLDQKTKLVTGTLADMADAVSQDWPVAAARTFLSLVIPLIVFFSLQRFFRQGLTAGTIGE